MEINNLYIARNLFQKEIRSGIDPRATRILCPLCQASIVSEMKWRCGHCCFENHRTSLYSFLYKCQSCDREPDSLICPNCKELVFLNEGHDNAHPAEYVVEVELKKLVPAKPEEDPQTRKRREHLERKVELEREIELEKLTTELAAIKDKNASGKENPTLVALRKSLDEYDLRHMGADNLARMKKEENSVKYKNDPECLEKANEVVDKWLEDLI